MGMLMGGIQTLPPIPLEHAPYDGQILNYYWFGHVKFTLEGTELCTLVVWKTMGDIRDKWTWLAYVKNK